MPIRPFKQIPKDLVEWGRYLQSTDVTPTDDSVGENQLQDGEVTFRKIQNVTPESLLGRYSATPGQVQEISVGGGLEFNGTSIQRSALTGDITAPTAGGVTAFRNFGALSVFGRSASTDGPPAEIVAGSNGLYLRRSGDVVGFGAIADADIPSTIARDTEVTAAITAHEAASDPHPQYALDTDLTSRPQQTTGTFTATLTGCSTSPTVTARYVITGQTVTVYIPSVNATSNATTCTLTGAPVAIRPTRDQGFQAVLVQNNGVLAVGLGRMLTTGVIDLRPGSPFGSTSWTNVGTKGPDHINLTYNLD